jgi:DNA-binding IscR family transcriptional regulator
MRLISREIEVALNVLHCLTCEGVWTSYALANQLKESRAFIAQVTHKLSRAKLIKARNGRHGGGYQLLKAPHMLTVAAVLKVFGKTHYKGHNELLAGPLLMIRLDILLRETTLSDLTGITLKGG